MGMGDSGAEGERDEHFQTPEVLELDGRDGVRTLLFPQRELGAQRQKMMVLNLRGLRLNRLRGVPMYSVESPAFENSCLYSPRAGFE